MTDLMQGMAIILIGIATIINARSIRPKAPKSTARMLSVNKCIWEGWTVFDITDSTVTPDRLEEGVVAYNSAGERIVGTAKIVRR